MIDCDKAEVEWQLLVSEQEAKKRQDLYATIALITLVVWCLRSVFIFDIISILCSVVFAICVYNST